MIYTITHKLFNDELVLNKDGYAVLHVGTNDSCKETYLRDDIGDNISIKNAHYCELTGLYWMWKNDKSNGNDIIGLCHYRRYFTYNIDDILYTYFNCSPRILSCSSATELLSKHQIILPKKEHIVRTLEEYYKDCHSIDDLMITREVIKSLSPDYIEEFDRVMRSHAFYYCNMLVTTKNIMDDYCRWLFSIMKEIESRIDAKGIQDKYQSRIYGFISERLLQVWVQKNKLSVKELPVYNTESKRLTLFSKNVNRIKHFIEKRST